jgi:isoleucyl-tRNA synthetase
VFRPVKSKLNINLLEEGMLRFWKSHGVIQKTYEAHPDGPAFVFCSNPPAVSGKPDGKQLSIWALQDVFARYKSMRGYRVQRHIGWQTHGIPIEIEVEKQLHIQNKHQLEEIGMAAFTEQCRQRVNEYLPEWERLTERSGSSADLKSAYSTCENEFIGITWGWFKQLWDKGLVQQGFKVTPYCPRCGTVLSDLEVFQGLADVEDSLTYVRLPLVEAKDTSLLVATTSPWTLPANVAVAVDADRTYATVERELPEGGKEKLILAEDLLNSVFGDEDVRVLERYPGRQLRGKRYHPLFTFMPTDKPAHYVVVRKAISTQEGTGLVQIAPAFGADDLQTALDEDLPMLMTIESDGVFVSDVRQWAGQFVKDVEPFIIQDLHTRGLLFRAETVRHAAPFCRHCSTRLLESARPVWLVRTSLRAERIRELNEEIEWLPHSERGSWLNDWLEKSAADWVVGRERYWGTPLPVWECENCHQQVCVGSGAELSEKGGKDLLEVDFHRPHIDDIHWPCSECGHPMRRVSEVLDASFDAAAAPDALPEQVPSDLVYEGDSSAWDWFYSRQVIAALVSDRSAFQKVIYEETAAPAEDESAATLRGTDPWAVISDSGADALRWYLYREGLSETPREFSKDLVSEVAKNLTFSLWAAYSFFITNAIASGWKPDTHREADYTALDGWLHSELNALIGVVTAAFERDDLEGVTRPIEAFIELLSTWYVPRVRTRIEKDVSSAGQHAAFSSLHRALIVVSQLIAPMMPFLAEELFQNLVRSLDPEGMLSVHMTDWPKPDPAAVDDGINQEMALVIRLAGLGHVARNKANLKVRQPLKLAVFCAADPLERQIIERYADLLAGELNVKQVYSRGSGREIATYSINPLTELLEQRYGSRYTEVWQALMQLPAEETAKRLMAGESVEIELEGVIHNVLPEEVEAQVVARSGYVAAADGPYLAVLSTQLTPELLQEGLAREFIRRVMDLREQANLDVTDRVQLYIETTPELDQAIRAFWDTIQAEARVAKLVRAEAPAHAVQLQDYFDSQLLRMGLIKADAD